MPTIGMAVLITLILGSIVFSVLGYVFYAPTLLNVLATLIGIFIIALALSFALLRGRV